MLGKHSLFVFTIKIWDSVYIYFLNVSGLYCTITHLHDYQCQPASPMNTQHLSKNLIRSNKHDKHNYISIM